MGARTRNIPSDGGWRAGVIGSAQNKNRTRFQIVTRFIANCVTRRDRALKLNRRENTLRYNA